MGACVRVLIVEDSSVAEEVLVRELQRNDLDVDHRRVETPEALREALENGPWDVVLCDYNLPGFTGLDVIAEMKSRGLDTPVILVSGSVDEQAVAGALKDGAQDFIPKGRLVRLVPAVLRELRAVRERRQSDMQLRRAQRLESIGLLAGGIAHDFNNILQAILGHAELLFARSREGTPDRRDVVEIRRAGERAATLTRQLLAFSRRQILRPKAIHLNAIVREMEGMLRRLLDERMELDFLLAPDLWLVKADPGQIEQVIMNLVVNARDAMPGGGRLSIGSRNVATGPGAEEVELSVRDTGCGMDAAVQARIFEPFFTTKGPGKGTGLGLSTVYGIVRQSGGMVEVESVPGRGTTFRVCFPRTTEPIEPEAPSAPSAAPKGGGERILVVEDDALVRELVREMVGQLGYPVVAAAGPMEALELSGSRRNPVALLLTDIVMPKMTGPQLYEQLRRIHMGLRVLFMSGYASGGSIQDDVLSSGVRWLQKPFTLDALASRIREVLDAPP